MWEDEEEQLLVCDHQSLAAAVVCMCVCICVHVPKLQRGVELLCASFCYVMRNHIRIHFGAGQAWQLGMLSVVLSPSTCSSCPVLLLLLLLIICPLLLPPEQTTACTARKSALSFSWCVHVRICAREKCACKVAWTYTTCTRFCTAGSQHTGTDSRTARGCFLQEFSNCSSAVDQCY